MGIVKQILEANRNPKMAADVDHEYENKYHLAEQLTNMAIASHMNCLEQLGLTLNILQELKAAASNGNTLSKSITLRFQAAEACTFLKEQTVEVPSNTTYKEETTEETQLGGTSKKTSIHSFTKRVKEYHWKVDCKWILRAFWGSDQSQGTELLGRSSEIIVVTQTNQSPIAKLREHPPIDILLNWLVEHVDPVKRTTVFHIQTDDAKTPRRNTQVDEALDYFGRMVGWAHELKQHFTYRLQSDIIMTHNPVVQEATDRQSWIQACQSLEILVPILPLLDDSEANSNASNTVTTERLSQSQLVIPSDGSRESGAKVNMSGDDCMKFLNEHVRSLEEKLQSLKQGFPPSQSTSVVSDAEAKMVALSGQIDQVSKEYAHAVNYIESMLEKQLIAAIGKRVTTEALEEFVRYHNARFLQPKPKAFCYSIGRPDHYPFGVVSLEKAGSGEPIHTLTRQVMSSPPLKLQMTEATTVSLTGKTYLHGWMNFRSQGENIANSFQVVARARQFSSFLLVVGTMMGSDELQPKDAIIIQNKDDVIIPLLLNELPSAKEFKDAVRSLSPEQRRFAEAFRSMQLSSSVFGIAVIQIKPQLERLLGLPEDALTKEIRLTQDLMELFVEYQVPSDLLSYDGETSDSVTSRQKVENVKSHVEAVLGVINAEKEKQLGNAGMRADMASETRVAEGVFGPTTIRPGGFAFTAMAAPSPISGGLFGAPSTATNQAFAFGGGGAPVGAPVAFGSPAPPPSAPAPSTGNVQIESPAYSDNESAAYSPTPPGSPQEESTPNYDRAFEQPLSGSKRKSSDSQKAQKIGGDQAKSGSGALVFSAIPKILDRKFLEFDKESALRSTTIKTAKMWTRKRQENLLKKAGKATLTSDAIRSETNSAYDLLDALSRSGSLSIPYSELHVVLCVSHCFQKSISDTVIQDNINPIERLEQSTLLLGSVIHGVKPYQLVTAGTQRERIESMFPALANA